MRAEIISVGTELLLGQIVDTNAPYLGEVLSTLGIDIFYRVTVGDNSNRLAEALRTALSRSDIVITIGGLGPTQDDLTKETIAEVLNERLIPDPESEKAIRDFFESRGLPMVQSNLKQALKPESAIILPNEMGTAPGILVDKSGKIIAAFPGPPREFIPMVDNALVPYLCRKTTGTSAIILSKTLRVTGIGESTAEDLIKDLLRSPNPTIAPYAKRGECHFRITAKAVDRETAERMIADLEAKAREKFGDHVYGTDNDSLETVVVRMLVERRLKIATAESCTGGLISSRITDVPGSSDTFFGGFVTYSNQAKTSFLGVPEELIRKHGAVSPEVAEAMAEGAASRTGAEIAIGISGIAGPGGGSEEKPVGLVYIALKTPKGVSSTKNMFGGGRSEINYRASQVALDAVRRYMIEE